MISTPTALRPFVELAAVAAVALALTFASYSPSLRAAFVSDDINAVVDNEWVTGVFDPVGIATNFSWWGRDRADSPGYRPAATASFALSRMGSGLDPFAFRCFNFVLHAGCVTLLFGLARALGLGREAAAAAAALFAVLPIHSEAVIWIVGRAELGAAAGFLAAAWLLVLHRRNGSTAALAGAVAALVVGLAFKENAITVLAWPAAMLLTLPDDDAAGTAPARRSAIASAALAAGGIAYALLRAGAHGPVDTAGPVSPLDNPLAVVDPATRLLGAVAILGRYLALTAWPAPLSVDYSFDALGIGPGFRANGDTVIALLFVGAAIAALRLARGRRDIAAAGLLMAVAAYSIVSNTVFTLGTILGERLFYLPSAGLCLAAAALAEPWLTKAAVRRRGNAVTRSRTVATVALAGLGIVAVLVNRHRAQEWNTPVSLFEAAVKAMPRSARAQMELASAYGNEGRLEEALPHFAEALRLHPQFAAAAYNRGNLLAEVRRYEDAAASYREAVQANPRLLRAWDNLALTERIRGNTRGWIDALRGASQAFPEEPTLAAQFGEALILAGQHGEAVRVFDGLLARGDTSATTYFNRGVAGHHLGGCAAAVDNYRKAAAAPAAPREAFTAASRCLRELGRPAEADEIDKAGQVANRGTRR